MNHASFVGLLGTLIAGVMVGGVADAQQETETQDTTVQAPRNDASKPKTAPESHDFLQRIYGIGGVFETIQNVEKPRSLAADLTRSLGYTLSYNYSSTTAILRTRRIMALRQLLKLGFSKADIETALPLLKRLRDIKSPPPADPEKALEEEYQALLKASPTEPLPPSSAQKITDAANYYRDEQKNVWAEMSQRLGKSKSDGLSNLLGTSNSLLNISQFLRTMPVPLPKTTTTKPQPNNPLASPDKPAKEGDTRIVVVRGDRTAYIRDDSTPFTTTRVVVDSTTVHLSLAELIDLMQEKLKAMSTASPTR